MEDLFGPWANKVTVHDLIFMASGIQDFEVGDLDRNLLKPDVSSKVNDPFDLLTFVANLPEKSPCLTSNCTWNFEPGTNHTSYSSTNFELAGYLLLAFMPEG